MAECDDLFLKFNDEIKLGSEKRNLYVNLEMR